MTFQYPYAFFVLLAIPVLILIYILKNKYKEATSPSTYLWEISQKFMKKRNPFHSIERLLALIVQCLTVAMLAVCLAHPVLELKNKAENMVFVLDASASMNMKDAEGVTRFEDAKKQIADVANDAVKGSTFTLISAEKEPRLVCQGITDPLQFSDYLKSIDCTYSVTELRDSLDEAQALISKGEGSVCYLATDKNYVFDEETNSYQDLTNIELIDVSTDQPNYAVTGLDYSYGKDSQSKQNTFVLHAYVISYANDKDKVKVRFTMNGDTSLGITSLDLTKGELKDFTITFDNSDGKYDVISSLKAEIVTVSDSGNSILDDCLTADNSFVVYKNKDTVSTKVLLVSKTPTYIKAAFNALSDNDPNTVKSQSTFNYYTDKGYDIYIFDGVAPDKLPTDGSVWFFGIGDEIPQGTGFQYSKTYDDKRQNNDYYTASYANNTDDVLYSELTANTSSKGIIVSTYNRYSITGDFTTLLSIDNTPVIFAGRNEENNNQREIVCSFKLSDSDLPLQYDFLRLLHNFTKYCNPTIMEDQYSYEIDEDTTLYVPDGLEYIQVTLPLQEGQTEPTKKLIYPGSEEYISYTFNQVGTYTITDIFTDTSKNKSIKVFVSYPREEEDPTEAGVNESIVIADDKELVKADGIYDSLLPVVIAAAVLFALDWGLYVHEHY